jgi:hypothetical protein
VLCLVSSSPSGVMSSRRLAVLAYGSLIHEPGDELDGLTRARRPARTPFRVEYGRASERWGGGPVLVPHPAGANVDGVLLLLKDEVTLGEAVSALARREGADPKHIVEAMLGPGVTALVANLPHNLAEYEMTPPALARRAIQSAGAGERNGVSYLRAALRSGIRTPRTVAYAREVCAAVGTSTLEEAEQRLSSLVPSADP